MRDNLTSAVLFDKLPQGIDFKYIIIHKGRVVGYIHALFVQAASLSDAENFKQRDSAHFVFKPFQKNVNKNLN